MLHVSSLSYIPGGRTTWGRKDKWGEATRGETTSEKTSWGETTRAGNGLGAKRPGFLITSLIFRIRSLYSTSITSAMKWTG